MRLSRLRDLWTISSEKAEINIDSICNGLLRKRELAFCRVDCKRIERDGILTDPPCKEEAILISRRYFIRTFVLQKVKSVYIHEPNLVIPLSHSKFTDYP